MIFVTGDTHSNVSKLNTKSFPEQKRMSKSDFVIILGDFGLVWNKNEDAYEKYWLDWLDGKPFTTLFVDGNHENFDRLCNEYEEKEWMGGLVHEIRPSVLHLKRGCVFELQGLKFFAFGGARSHDIDDGVYDAGDPKLEELKKLERDGYSPMYRINHVSWWAEEMPCKEEMSFGMENLAKHDFCVDYIITHDLPASSLVLYRATRSHFETKPDELEEYLEEVRIKTKYKMWFCGHHHDECRVAQKEAILYNQIVRIA